jgi:hypothetical protein
MSAGERRERHTPSGFAGMGRGPLAGLGRMASPGPFSYFLFFSSFSFFLFLIFISFEKMLQIKSNHFLNSSNIPCNAPNQ